MSDIIKLSIIETLDLLNKREITAKELISTYIKQAQKHKKLNCFITENFELALKQAELADEKYANKTNRILEAIPVGIKDLFCTDSIKTTAGSKMLEDFVPFYESTVSAKLKESGAISLGKLNMDEFAMGSSNTTSYFGNVINPWKRRDSDIDLVPGGSSGGSASAVSSFSVMGALGSDTGGSIRQPAAFTGLVGSKPTYGRCSRWGMISFASSLDQAGVFTRSVKDNALLLQTIMGFDQKDSTSSPKIVPDLLKNVGQDIKGKKIGIPRFMMDMDGIEEDILSNWKDSIKKLEELGAKIIDIELPNAKHAISTYYVIAPAEASSNLARYDGVRYGYRTDNAKNIDETYIKTRSEAFGEEVKRRILIGTYVLSSSKIDAYYIRAQKVRKLIANDFQNNFEKIDAILMPTTPSSAFGINENQDDPLKMYLNDLFTIPASLAGLPCISVPTGFDKEHLPIGMQLITNSFNEELLFNIAYNLEKTTGKEFIAQGVL